MGDDMELLLRIVSSLDQDQIESIIVQFEEKIRQKSAGEIFYSTLLAGDMRFFETLKTRVSSYVCLVVQ